MSIIHTVYTAKQCVHIDIDSVDMVYGSHLLLRVGNNAISMTPTDENFCFLSGFVAKKHPGSLMNLLRNSISVLIMIVKTKWSVWAIFMLTMIQKRQRQFNFAQVLKFARLFYSIPECIVLGTELK